MNAGPIIAGGLGLLASLLAVAGTTAYFVDSIAEAKQSGLEAQLTGNAIRYEAQLFVLSAKVQDQEVVLGRLGQSCSEVERLLGSRLLERRKNMEERLQDASSINKSAIEVLGSLAGEARNASSIAEAFSKYESDMVVAIASYDAWHIETEKAFGMAKASVAGLSEPIKKHIEAVLKDMATNARPMEAGADKKDGDTRDAVYKKGGGN